MIYTILIIIFVHWFADFVMQTSWQAENKSSNNEALLHHTLIYTAIWAIPAGFLFHNGFAIAFFLLNTFVFHTATDYFTSRINTYLYKKGDIHNFFVSVGFDQFLHYCQLLITYYFLTK